uniref:Uncharacterized protein n=1 Tax=Meloidogyne enterolobii TaxID=390850 RepID=A0A6V7XGA1_MELEN|nr:unnamed protein product [Meloidogyne enterolobii]
MQKLILLIIIILTLIIFLTSVIPQDEESESPFSICNADGTNSKLSKRFQIQLDNWVGTQACDECDDCNIKRHASFNKEDEEQLRNGGFLTDYTTFGGEKENEDNECQKVNKIDCSFGVFIFRGCLIRLN